MTDEPKIDMPLPPAPPKEIDISIPEKKPGIQPEHQRQSPGEELENFTPKEISGNLDALREIDPEEYAQFALNIFAARGEAVRYIENKAAAYLEKGKENPKDMAVGLDLKMEALQTRLYTIKERMEKAKDKNLEELFIEEQQILKELATAHGEREDLVISNPELAGNQLTEFAEQFGIPPEFIDTRSSLLAVQRFITSAIEKKSVAVELIARVREHSMPEELVGKLEQYINHETHDKQEKKYGKKAAVIGGSMGLMMVLTAWFAMKMESGKRQ